MGRALVDRFEDFRVDLTEHAGVGDGNRQHASRRPKANGAHEQQSPDDLRHAAQNTSKPRTGMRSSRDHSPGRPPREAALSDRARLAKRLVGTASSNAKAMPAVATASVCKVASKSSERKSLSCAGGQKALTKLPIC